MLCKLLTIQKLEIHTYTCTHTYTHIHTRAHTNTYCVHVNSLVDSSMTNNDYSIITARRKQWETAVTTNRTNSSTVVSEVCMSVSMCMCMCVCVCVCVCVQIDMIVSTELSKSPMIASRTTISTSRMKYSL